MASSVVSLLAWSDEELHDLHEHATRDHVVVRISDVGIEPATQVLDSETAVVWLNYGRVPIEITLDQEASSRVSCREPTHFIVSRDGTLRAPILETSDSASLCLLKPGSYFYTVSELDTVSRPIRPRSGGRKFRGTLVVQGAPPNASKDSAIWRLAIYHWGLATREHEIARFYEELASSYEILHDLEAARRERKRAAETRAAAKMHAAKFREFKATAGPIPGLEGLSVDEE